VEVRLSLHYLCKAQLNDIKYVMTKAALTPSLVVRLTRERHPEFPAGRVLSGWRLTARERAGLGVADSNRMFGVSMEPFDSASWSARMLSWRSAWELPTALRCGG
jgi:hypothetical protein